MRWLSQLNFIKIRDDDKERLSLLRDKIKRLVKVAYTSKINGEEGNYIVFINYVDVTEEARR